MQLQHHRILSLRSEERMMAYETMIGESPDGSIPLHRPQATRRLATPFTDERGQLGMDVVATMCLPCLTGVCFSTFDEAALEEGESLQECLQRQRRVRFFDLERGLNQCSCPCSCHPTEWPFESLHRRNAVDFGHSNPSTWSIEAQCGRSVKTESSSSSSREKGPSSPSHIGIALTDAASDRSYYSGDELDYTDVQPEDWPLRTDNLTEVSDVGVTRVHELATEPFPKLPSPVSIRRSRPPSVRVSIPPIELHIELSPFSVTTPDSSNDQLGELDRVVLHPPPATLVAESVHQVDDASSHSGEAPEVVKAPSPTASIQESRSTRSNTSIRSAVQTTLGSLHHANIKSRFSRWSSFNYSFADKERVSRRKRLLKILERFCFCCTSPNSPLSIGPPTLVSHNGKRPSWWFEDGGGGVVGLQDGFNPALGGMRNMAPSGSASLASC